MGIEGAQNIEAITQDQNIDSQEIQDLKELVNNPDDLKNISEQLLQNPELKQALESAFKSAINDIRNDPLASGDKIKAHENALILQTYAVLIQGKSPQNIGGVDGIFGKGTTNILREYQGINPTQNSEETPQAIEQEEDPIMLNIDDKATAEVENEATRVPNLDNIPIKPDISQDNNKPENNSSGINRTGIYGEKYSQGEDGDWYDENGNKGKEVPGNFGTTNIIPDTNIPFQIEKEKEPTNNPSTPRYGESNEDIDDASQVNGNTGIEIGN